MNVRLLVVAGFIGFTVACNPTTPKNISGTVSVANGITSGEIASSQAYVPNQVLVKFKSGLQVQSDLSVAGVTLQTLRPLGLENTRLMQANADVPTLVAALSRRADVEWAQPNFIQYAKAAPNDQFYNFQWHYPSINLEAAWDIEKGDSNPVTVAVLDSGILSAHPDFAGKILPGYDMISDPTRARDGDGRDANPEDVGDLIQPTQSSYHGAHVAGTIAATTNNKVGVAGVSWGAKILPVRVLGLGGSGTVADIIDGMLWAAGLTVPGTANNLNPAHILNMSLGGNGTCAQTPAYQNAINQINAVGKIIVVAAGNENMDASNTSPASCSGVITVGATEFAKARAPYSNFGTRIDVMAPGGDTSADLNGDQIPDGVISTIKNDTDSSFDYSTKNGTSMAAPHVAGVIALMKSKDPTLTYARALDILTRTATPLTAGKCTGSGTAKLPQDCGAGLIDAAAALQALGNPNTPTQDFSLSFSPSSLRLAPGANQNVVLTIVPTGGFNGSPSFSLDAPSGFNLQTLSTNGNTATLRLSVAANVANGNYSLALTGSAGALVRKAILNVNVQSTVIQPTTLGGTKVVACFIASPDDLCNETNSKLITLNSSGSSANYTLSDLADGSYFVIAWKDSNSNDKIDSGDLLGIASNAVSPPASNINIAVSIVQNSTLQPGSDFNAKVRAFEQMLFKLLR
ncbi:MAG: S8 family peptidase [Deinococcales bacterium]